MMPQIATGLVLGLSAGIAPGPLLAFLITQTLRHGIKEGLKVAIVPIITDVPIIILCFFILTKLVQFKFLLGIISIIGGGYLVYLAYETLLINTIDIKGSDHPPNSLLKGTIVNLFNPHPYLFWITIGGPIVIKAKQLNPLAPFLFIGSFYLLLVGSKVFLAITTGKARKVITGKWYQHLNRILGLLLFIFALFLFKDGITLFGQV